MEDACLHGNGRGGTVGGRVLIFGPGCGGTVGGPVCGTILMPSGVITTVDPMPGSQGAGVAVVLRLYEIVDHARATAAMAIVMIARAAPSSLVRARGRGLNGSVCDACVCSGGCHVRQGRGLPLGFVLSRRRSSSLRGAESIQLWSKAGWSCSSSASRGPSMLIA